MIRYAARIHSKESGFISIQWGEMEVDERGEPKQDREYVYLLTGPVSRKHILSIQIERIPDED